MAFPTTSELDSFNRANSESLGADWTNDSIGAGSGGLAIESNRAVTSLSAYGENYYDVASYTNPEAWMETAVYADGGSFSGGLRLLMSPGSAAADGYGIQVSESGRFKIIQVNNGDDNTVLADESHLTTPGEIVGVSLNSSTGEIKGYVDGVEVATATDGTYTGPFFLSLWGYNGAGSSLIWRWESFGGGEMVIVPPTATPIRPDYSLFPKAKLRRT